MDKQKWMQKKCNAKPRAAGNEAYLTLRVPYIIFQSVNNQRDAKFL